MLRESLMQSTLRTPHASSFEFQRLAELAVVEFAVVPGEMSVDPRRGDAAAERVTLERRPAAFGDDVSLHHALRFFRIDQRQVGPIDLADETALMHIETFRRRVR